MKLSGNKPLQVFLAVCLIPILIIVVCKFLMLGDKPAPENATQKTNVVAQEKGQRTPPPVAFGHAAEASHHSDAEQAVSLDAEGRKARAHSRRIAAFMKSPARDTPECRKILKILLDNGRSIESLPEVYDMAFQVGKVDPDRVGPSATVNGKPYDASNPAHVKFSAAIRDRDASLARVRLEQAGYSSKEIDGVLAVNPKVAYGNVGVDINLDGARTDCTDEDLLKYLAEHPVSP